MLRIAILLLCFMVVGARAQAVDAYRVEVPVASQSEADRIAAAKATLGDVIVRITGDSAALTHPLVRDALADAPNYLAKFSYPNDKTLLLNYSPQAVNRLLQSAQLMGAPNSGVLAVQVENVQSFAAFKQAQAYIKTLAVVRRAELVSVSNDKLLFNLTLDGDLALLKNTLAASSHLQIAGDEGASPLSLRWQN